MKILYKFYWNCGKQGSLKGIFVAEEDLVKQAIGQKLYFGEVLGKHSEIFGILEEKDLIVITDDQDFIEKFEKLDCSSGYNPLNWLPEQELDD